MFLTACIHTHSSTCKDTHTLLHIIIKMSVMWFSECARLWNRPAVSGASLWGNFMFSPRRRGFSLCCVGPPRQSHKPACSAVMVFVLAWLPLALGSGSYYSPGSRFIMATLQPTANFPFPSLSLAYYPRLQGKAQEPPWPDEPTPHK